jgi:uncharacterized damage-inducible protein DinB
VSDDRPRAPYAGDERATLLGFLDRHRATFRWKAGGLDRGQLDQSLPPSDLTLGGMVKHLAFVEDWWFGRMLQGVQVEPWVSVDWRADGDWDWHSAADDTPEQLWELYDDAVRRSEHAVRNSESLDSVAELRTHGTDEPISLRWILVHMIEEYARHNGHADLIRQSIDGSVGQ